MKLRTSEIRLTVSIVGRRFKFSLYFLLLLIAIEAFLESKLYISTIDFAKYKFEFF